MEISNNGNKVAFYTSGSLVPQDINNVADTYVVDSTSGVASLASVAWDGSIIYWGATQPCISGDGRFVGFTASWPDVVPNDNNTSPDIFIRDLQLNQISRVSVSSDGTEANSSSLYCSLSGDGRYVAFESTASNLTPGDTFMSRDVFLHDRDVDEDGIFDEPGAISTINLSKPLNGEAWNGQSGYPSISDDGRMIAFYSVATNLVPGDTNGVADIFVYDQGGTGILVQDEAFQPVAGAQVFRNGKLAGTTGSDGVFTLLGLKVGDKLVARQGIVDPSTAKSNHSQDAATNWAYRVYITSLDIPATGEPIPFTVVNPNMTQVLTVKKSNPLTGFNIVASLNWDATDAYINDLKQGFALASDYLYDASDGQMLFERVTIYDNSYSWANADYQIEASNQVWPSANVGPLIPSLRTNYIYFGRAFNGTNALQGPWTDPDAYRTMIHEFGHYGLGLYDSYFYLNAAGVKVNSNCISAAIRTNATSATNATLMDFQFNSTEFAMQGVANMWSPSCLLTKQFQLRGKADWASIEEYYKDWQNPARWILNTPATRGVVVEGPTLIPVSEWTKVEAVNRTAGACLNPPLIVNVNSAGTPLANSVVWLKRISKQIIEQGKSNAAGQIAVLGAGPGDLVYAGNVATTTMTISGTATVPACATRSDQGELGIFQELTITLHPSPFEIYINVWPGELENELNVGVSASKTISQTPVVGYHQGGITETLPITVVLDAIQGAFTGTAVLSSSEPLEGGVIASVKIATQTIESYLPFELYALALGESFLIWSADHLAELFGAAGCIQEAGNMLISQNPPPGPPPNGLLMIGNPYAIYASEYVTFTQDANLTIFYSEEWENALRVYLFGADIYAWESGWIKLESTIDKDLHFVAAPVSAFTSFAIMTSAEPIMKIYLPLVVR